MLTEGAYLDHVIYGVQDVDAAAEGLRRDYGLGSIPGGIHLGGTTNRIVPLAPPTFLELLGIGDPALADGAWLSQVLGGRDRVLWWALGVDDLDETARRRGLPIQVGMMDMADGSRRTFRTAGMHRYPLPFFLAFEMKPGDRMRLWQDRYREAAHDCEPGAFTFVEVGDTREHLDAWLGDHLLPVRYAPAETSGIRAVGIATAAGEVVIH